MIVMHFNLQFDYDRKCDILLQGTMHFHLIFEIFTYVDLKKGYFEDFCIIELCTGLSYNSQLMDQTKLTAHHKAGNSA